MNKSTEPAFRSANPNAIASDPFNAGLTKREYFAAMAMQGLLAMGPDGYDDRADLCAIVSVRHADALLAELDKKSSNPPGETL